MCVLSERPGLLIAGVGNRYRGDDAVGLRLVEQWPAAAGELVVTELWEDFDGAAVAHRLVESDRPVLMVDCAEMGLRGGAFRVLDGRKVEKMLTRSVVSTHGLGLAEGIKLAGALGYTQPLWVFGVQPFSIGMGGDLSPAMVAVLPGLRQGLFAAVSQLSRQRAAG